MQKKNPAVELDDSRLLCLFDELCTKLNKISPKSKVVLHPDNNMVTSYTCIVKASVDNFLRTKANIIYVDGSFCSDGGKILCMSFLDQNHHLQPFGCHYCFSETSDGYTTLFE